MITTKRIPQTIIVNNVVNRTTNPPQIPHNELQYTKTYSYQNGFSYPITVIEKNGLGVTFPGNKNFHREHRDFMVHVRYDFYTEVNIDACSLLDVTSDSGSAELTALRAALMDLKKQGTNVVKHLHLVYTVTSAEFEVNGSEAYIDDLDIVICTADKANHVVHPNSGEGKIIKSKIVDSVTDFVYQIHINDPFGEYGQKYMSLNGKVYRIPVSVDPTKPVGVEIVTTNQYMGPNKTILSSELYSFEEAAEKLALYATSAEAASNGDSLGLAKRQHEERVLELKNDLMIREDKIRQDKERHEMLMAEQQRRYDALDSEHKQKMAEFKLRLLGIEEDQKHRDHLISKQKAELEEASMRRKDHYEHRSYNRKDSSEVIKWLPALAIGAGIAWKIFS